MANSVSGLRKSGVLLGGFGAQHVAPVQDREIVGNFESITPWTALSNDTTGIAVDASHVLGSLSLEFDKVDGADNEVFAGVSATIPAVDLSRFGLEDKLVSLVYISNITNVAYAFIRLGTSVSHYNEWRLADTVITQAIWQPFSVTLAATEVAITGNGWTPSAVTYVCVGVMFDAEANALADIRFDSLAIERANLTAT